MKAFVVTYQDGEELAKPIAVLFDRTAAIKRVHELNDSDTSSESPYPYFFDECEVEGPQNIYIVHEEDHGDVSYWLEEAAATQEQQRIFGNHNLDDDEYVCAYDEDSVIVRCRPLNQPWD